MMKKIIFFSVAALIIIALIWYVAANQDRDKGFQADETSETTKHETEEVKYPITDVWVYRYNALTGESDFAACGYIDEYTSLVSKSDEKITKIITGSQMYLGTIKGYQNKDKTIEVYQVRLPELSESFTLTNDEIELDYSGKKNMIEVDGWIYLNGNTILAVSPLYSDN